MAADCTSCGAATSNPDAVPGRWRCAGCRVEVACTCCTATTSDPNVVHPWRCPSCQHYSGKTAKHRRAAMRKKRRKLDCESSGTPGPAAH